MTLKTGVMLFVAGIDNILKYIQIGLYNQMQSWPKISAPFGKYDQRRLRKCICIVNPFDLFFY